MFTLLSLAALAEEAIDFRIEGLESSSGPVICTLYRGKDTWLKKTGFVASMKVAVVDGTASCRFEGVPAGSYAISFLHDVNENGKMDTHWYGLPKEPWGVSRDAPMRMGPPKYDDAVFEHPGATLVAHPL